MRINNFVIAITILMTVSCSTAKSSYLSEIKDFSSDEKIEELILHCKNSGNGTLKAEFNEQSNFKWIIDGVLAGDESVLRVAVPCRNQFQGGNLGDIYRAIGSYTHKNVGQLIDYLSDAAVSNYEIERIFAMLPLSYVDDLNGKLEEVKKRKDLIQQAETSNLMLKNKIISVLENEEKFLSKLLTKP